MSKIKIGKVFQDGNYSLSMINKSVFLAVDLKHFTPPLSPLSHANAHAHMRIHTQTITSFQAFRMHSGHPCFSDQMDKIP